MKRYFRIGDFSFQIEYEKEIQIPEHLLLFENQGDWESHLGEQEYHYTIKECDIFPSPDGRLIAKRKDLKVYESEGKESRYIGIKGQEGFYGLYRELANQKAEIWNNRMHNPYMNVDPVFASLFALEKHLLAVDSMVLHCAYVDYMGQAILFSAPSETGKTTQANLWEKYRGARTINGDRGLLFKKDGVWHAGGWPVCGSSEICENISMPVRAIVILSQAKENSVERLQGMRAFSPVYSQITINRWNNEAHMKAMNLIEALVSEVQVYHLACNISEDAVVCLEKQLFEER